METKFYLENQIPIKEEYRNVNFEPSAELAKEQLRLLLKKQSVIITLQGDERKEKKQKNKLGSINNNNNSKSITTTTTTTTTTTSNERVIVSNNNKKPFEKPTEEYHKITNMLRGDVCYFKLLPKDSNTRASYSLEKPCLKTSPLMQIIHVKKFLLLQFNKLDVSTLSSIVVYCEDEIMEDNYTLQFILNEKWMDERTDLVLKYQLVKF